MNIPRPFYAAICSAILLLSAAPCHGDVKLPSVLNSHMVLQRDAPLNFWGWAEAGEDITVTMRNASVSTKADTDGNWSVTLPAQKADKQPRTITIAGNNTVELTDVLIGEVWVGSGQSNMEWALSNTQNSKTAIAAANHPTIRLFHVPKVQTKTPSADVKAEWKTCTSENIPRFSAVLYYFGIQLQKELDVPIGLINSSWGGSPIEPWTIANESRVACTTA